MAEGELGKIAVKVLAAYEVMDAINLALEQAPGVLQPVCVNEVVLHILADGVVDRMMVKLVAKLRISPVFIRHDVRAGCHIRINLGIQCFGRGIGNHFGAQLAVTLHNAHDRNLVCAALAARGPLMGVLVLLFAADVGFIRLNHAFKRLVERFGAGGMAEAMQHEPRRFLRDL